jgi:hypothetical protein
MPAAGATQYGPFLDQRHLVTKGEMPMRSDKLLAALIAGTAACGAAFGQHITRVEGPNTSALDVRVLDELQPTAAGSIHERGRDAAQRAADRGRHRDQRCRRLRPSGIASVRAQG